jgi:hypothetical protein
MPENVRASIARIRSATVQADEMVGDLQIVVADLKQGKGTASAILRILCLL